MAASGDVKGGFKQDMVVSTRYRNDLPPPPMPPKLLDIDNGGLAQYLTTSFASGLARREEPNIEVDAEGGMPIDMIGIPGYFLGDESGACLDSMNPMSTRLMNGQRSWLLKSNRSSMQLTTLFSSPRNRSEIAAQAIQTSLFCAKPST